MSRRHDSSTRAASLALLAELDSPAHFGRITSADALASAFDQSTHPSLRMKLEAVGTALESTPPMTFEASLAAAAVANEQALALGIAVLLRQLRHLQLLPAELHAEVLSVRSGALASLLRRRLPPAHAAFIDALGTTLGNVLQRCGILFDRAPPPAAHERAVRAMLFGLAPALMRSAAALPPDERPAAEAATRHLLRHFAQRQNFRALAAADSGAPDATANGGVGRVGLPPPLSPVISAHGAPTTRFAGAAPAGGAMSARARGGALAMRSVASSINTLFEREFSVVPPAATT